MAKGPNKIVSHGANGSIAGGVSAATASTLTQLDKTGTVDGGKVMSDSIKGAAFGFAGGAVSGKAQAVAAKNTLGDFRAIPTFSSQAPGAKTGSFLGTGTGIGLSIADTVKTASDGG